MVHWKIIRSENKTAKRKWEFILFVANERGLWVLVKCVGNIGVFIYTLEEGRIEMMYGEMEL